MGVGGGGDHHQALAGTAVVVAAEPHSRLGAAGETRQIGSERRRSKESGCGPAADATPAWRRAPWAAPMMRTPLRRGSGLRRHGPSPSLPAGRRTGRWAAAVLCDQPSAEPPCPLVSDPAAGRQFPGEAGAACGQRCSAHVDGVQPLPKERLDSLPLLVSKWAWIWGRRKPALAGARTHLPVRITRPTRPAPAAGSVSSWRSSGWACSSLRAGSAAGNGWWS